jgi:hypothetical protein
MEKQAEGSAAADNGMIGGSHGHYAQKLTVH